MEATVGSETHRGGDGVSNPKERDRLSDFQNCIQGEHHQLTIALSSKVQAVVFGKETRSPLTSKKGNFVLFGGVKKDKKRKVCPFFEVSSKKLPIAQRPRHGVPLYQRRRPRRAGLGSTRQACRRSTLPITPLPLLQTQIVKSCLKSLPDSLFCAFSLLLPGLCLLSQLTRVNTDSLTRGSLQEPLLSSTSPIRLSSLSLLPGACDRPSAVWPLPLLPLLLRLLALLSSFHGASRAPWPRNTLSLWCA
jgi:hypothetical protein